MARRNGRKGDHLVTDDYTGATIYASQARRDFWGNYTRRPLQRNLQEISIPLNDPAPVEVYRGPDYETVNPSAMIALPATVGVTAVAPKNTSPAAQRILRGEYE